MTACFQCARRFRAAPFDYLVKDGPGPGGLYTGSFGIGLGAVAIAFTFRAPRRLAAVLPAPSVAF